MAWGTKRGEPAPKPPVLLTEEQNHELAEAFVRMCRRAEAAETEIANLQSALIAAGHDVDCPVVWGASADCVPGSACMDYQAEVSQLRAALAVYADEGNWEDCIWNGELDGPDVARRALAGEAPDA